MDTTTDYRRPHTRAEILRAACACCRIWAGHLRSARGYSLRSLFADAERCGAIVLWGFWADADLDTIIQ